MEQPVAATNKNLINLNCPSCGGENTQKLSSIHDAGTSHGTTQSVGFVGGRGGGNGFGGMTSSSGTTFSQTSLAKKLAPPKKKMTAKIIFLGVVVTLGTLWTVVIPFIAIPASIYFYRKNKAFNTIEYPKLMEPWLKQYYCHRCENVFIPG